MQTSLKDINKVFPRTKTLFLHGIISLLLAYLAGKYIDNEAGGMLAVYSLICFFFLIVRHFVIYVKLRAMYESEKDSQK